MLISKEQAELEAKMLIERTKNDEFNKYTEYINKLEKQKELIFKLFKTEFDKWYVGYLVGINKIPCKLNIINNDYIIYDGCINPIINYNMRLFPKYKKDIINELYTTINNELVDKKLKISNVKTSKQYYCGEYLDFEISICDINSYRYCSIM